MKGGGGAWHDTFLWIVVCAVDVLYELHCSLAMSHRAGMLHES